MNSLRFEVAILDLSLTDITKNEKIRIFSDLEKKTYLMQLKMCFNLNYVICILDTIHYILYCNIYYAIVVLHAKDIKIFSYTAATICYNQSPCYNVLLLLKANRTICNVFNSRLIANCTFFFRAFLESFFRNTCRDMDDAFCPSTSFVGIEFKYSFTFRSKKIFHFKLYKIISDFDATVNCNSLK